MPATEDDFEAATAELTSAMARFVRALDAVGDSDAAKRLSPDLVGSVERLATRLGGMEGFGG